MRIDPRLWAELETWAQQDLRSINGQIEFLLREAVLRRKRSTSDFGPARVRPETSSGTADTAAE